MRYDAVSSFPTADEGDEDAADNDDAVVVEAVDDDVAEAVEVVEVVIAESNVAIVEVVMPLVALPCNDHSDDDVSFATLVGVGVDVMVVNDDDAVR